MDSQDRDLEIPVHVPAPRYDDLPPPYSSVVNEAPANTEETRDRDREPQVEETEDHLPPPPYSSVIGRDGRLTPPISYYRFLLMLLLMLLMLMLMLMLMLDDDDVYI